MFRKIFVILLALSTAYAVGSFNNGDNGNRPMLGDTPPQPGAGTRYSDVFINQLVLEHIESAAGWELLNI